MGIREGSLRAEVTQFTEEQGFGKANVDGDELVFDVTVIRGRIPAIGEPVQVIVGPGRLRPRILGLWTLEPEVVNMPLLPPRRAIAILQEHGLARELTPRRLRDLLDDEPRRGGRPKAEPAEGRVTNLDELGDRDAALSDILTAFYRGDRTAALRDGFATYDWQFGNETDDVFADLDARIGGASPLLVQVENDLEEGILRARSRSGEERVFDFNENVSLHDITHWFDEELLQNRDRRRFFSAAGSDAYVFLLLEPRVALDLHRRRALAFEAHPTLPLCAYPSFEAAAAAYRSGAYKTATAAFDDMLGELDGNTSPSDRRWLELLVKLSASFGRLTIHEDAAGAQKLLDEIAATVRSLPDGGLGLDTTRLRKGITSATKKLPSWVPPEQAMPVEFAPPLVFQV